MPPSEPLKRHFTATGYIATDEAILLHWHKKLRMWLPPGGHIEENEDPVEAVVREAKEESGLDVEVVHPGGLGPFVFTVPRQLHPPVAILVEDIDDPVDGVHQHIDLIYFTVPADASQRPNEGWLWITRQQLADAITLETPDGDHAVPPPDVLEVGVLAIDAQNMRHA
jgi:8-oxo-dGTP pyrophosphatase MutT (NUDIX family)